MVARAAFLRSRKNAACSSELSWTCCRRLVAIQFSLLPRDGQMYGQEALGLLEALLRHVLGISGVRAYGEALTSALVEPERTRLTQIAHPRLHPKHALDGRLLVLRPVQDQHGDVHALGEIVRLGAALSARRPEGEAVEDDDDTDLGVRSGRHECVHPSAAEAEHGQPLEVRVAERSQKAHRALHVAYTGPSVGSA